MGRLAGVDSPRLRKRRLHNGGIQRRTMTVIRFICRTMSALQVATNPQRGAAGGSIGRCVVTHAGGTPRHMVATRVAESGLSNDCLGILLAPPRVTEGVHVCSICRGSLCVHVKRVVTVVLSPIYHALLNWCGTFL